MLIWANRLVQVLSTVAIGLYLYTLLFTDQQPGTGAFLVVLVSVIVSVITQWLVLRAEQGEDQ